jgi:hypothetical protein
MGFKRLEAEDFLVSADSVSQTVWTDRKVVLDTFHTSSTQEQASVSGDYYLAVYQTASTSISAEPQFDISYGDVTGGGGVLYNNNVSGKLLKNGTNTLRLTDASTNITIPIYYGTQRAYQIVRQGGSPGSSDGIHSGETTRGSYGLFLPDTGLIILNGLALDLPAGQATLGAFDVGIGLATQRQNDAQNMNPSKLFNVIREGGSFKLNCEETLSSDFVFVRVRNSEFNYTENPSFMTGTTGEVYHNSSINNPQVYITTVGMYNDQNELLGVAKLSKPLLKDFTKEALVRVKLDF